VTRSRSQRTLPAAALFAAFCAGMLFEWTLHRYGPPIPATISHRVAMPPGATNQAAPLAEPSDGDGRVKATSGVVKAAPLRLPIDGANLQSFKGGFAEKRAGHMHDAVDMLAPRNTPVHAVADGTVAKLFFSKGGGGNTIYEFDPSGHYAYYYAHLERYADGIHDGQTVSKGQVIGYVGTSGNAPPDTPHLHFAVLELNADRQWWKGRAIDPYPLFK